MDKLRDTNDEIIKKINEIIEYINKEEDRNLENMETHLMQYHDVDD